MWFGGVGCGIFTLALYTPQLIGHQWVLADYRLLLRRGAGRVRPLSALLPTLAPDNKGAAMSVLNLGSGLYCVYRLGIVSLFIGPLGAGGVIWIFTALYFRVPFLTRFLTISEQSTRCSIRRNGLSGKIMQTNFDKTVKQLASLVKPNRQTCAKRCRRGGERFSTTYLLLGILCSAFNRSSFRARRWKLLSRCRCMCSLKGIIWTAMSALSISMKNCFLLMIFGQLMPDGRLWNKKGYMLFRRQMDDISPLSKVNGYIGVSDIRWFPLSWAAWASFEQFSLFKLI